eukprot:COSAG04_NODE_5868_length_1468_cov_1.135866_1_plen_372_part_01
MPRMPQVGPGSPTYTPLEEPADEAGGEQRRAGQSVGFASGTAAGDRGQPADSSVTAAPGPERGAPERSLAEEVEAKMDGRKEVCGRASFDPHGNRRVAWDAVIMVTILYTFLIVPIRIAFGSDVDLGALSVFVETFTFKELAIDVLWTLDVAVQARTGYTDSDTGWVVYDKRKILKRYCKAWLWVDLAAVLPSLYVVAVTIGGGTVGGLLQHGALRLIKTLRLCDGSSARVKSWLLNKVVNAAEAQKVQSRIPELVVNSAAWLSVVFCITHILACLWCASPDTSRGRALSRLTQCMCNAAQVRCWQRRRVAGIGRPRAGLGLTGELGRERDRAHAVDAILLLVADDHHDRRIRRRSCEHKPRYAAPGTLTAS